MNLYHQVHKQTLLPLQWPYYAKGAAGAAFWKSLRHQCQASGDLAELQAEGERLVASPPVELTYSLFALFRTRGSRLEYERVYFAKRRRLNTFALLSLLDSDSEAADVYFAALLDVLWSICSEFTWCLPAHVGEERPVSETIDLFAAETGFALAEISLLLGERLPRMLRERMAEQVEARLFKPFLEQGPYEWEEARHNWAAVCGGSIGAAALLLLQEAKDAPRLASILERTERAMSFYLQGFGEDGACLEGLDYWNYGFGYFVYYADLLYHRSGGEMNWFALDQVKRIATFQQKCFLGGFSVANFSDALPEARVQLGLSHYLAEKYKGEVAVPPERLRAEYSRDHCSRWAPALRNLIWRNYGAAPMEWGAGDFYLEQAAWLVSRYEWAGEIYGFAAKGGHNGEPHNHNDLGHFLLVGQGQSFLSDLGCGEYTRDYFGAGRYDYAANGSHGHSVPQIDGVMQSSGADRKAVVLEQATSTEECRLVVELSGAYSCEKLVSYQRSWNWKKADLPSLLLQDDFQFAEVPGSLIERFVTWIKPDLSLKGMVVLRREKLAVEIHYDSHQLNLEVDEQNFRDHFGNDLRWYALDFSLLKQKMACRIDFRFAFVWSDG